jgi:hypothetical protein
MTRSRSIALFGVVGVAPSGCPESQIDRRPEVLVTIGQVVLQDLDEAHGDAQALFQSTLTFCRNCAMQAALGIASCTDSTDEL